MAGAPETSTTPARHVVWRGAVPVMALAAGLLFGVSAGLASGAPGHDPPADLPGLIQQRNDQVQRLTTRAAELQTEVEALSKRATPQGVSNATADALAPLVGTGAVRGPALQVTLDDAGYTLQTLPKGYTVDDVVVHQQDVQAVVNAMWEGGAEAMMIQDQRIVATSAVQCVGNTLYLQGRVYSPPYTITAIGDVEAMESALQADPTVTNYRGWSEVLGLGYDVQRVGEVELPAFSAGVPPQYAEPIPPAHPKDT